MNADSEITQALLLMGPWVVLAMTFLETFFLSGLVIPALPTIMAACLLAVEGHFSMESVVAATFVGGFAGDQVGFWIGRRGGRRLLQGPGRVHRMARRHSERASGLMQRHAFVGVSLARCISFVRTLMPLTAGMSELRYGRYLAFELAGLALWGTGSILVGVGAALGWQRVRDDLGVEWALAGVAAGVAVWVVLRVRRLRRETHGVGA